MEVTTYTSTEQESFDLEITVEHCASCGNWHSPEDSCPEIVEVA
jgi:hypothetical protein